MSADFRSTTLAEHVESLGTISVDVELGDRVARLTGEGLISMRDAAKIYGRNTHKSTPSRHAIKGVKRADGSILKLESIRCSGAICTSRAAVLRFLAAQNEPPGATPAPTLPTPRQRNRAAESASAEVAAILK